MAKRKKQYRDDVRLKLIGEKIRAIRIAKGLTQNDLAFACEEADWSQISRMERGMVNFTVSYLLLVAEKLDVETKELLP